MKEETLLEIAYLADHPEYIQVCASWAYGHWGCQSGVSHELRDYTPWLVSLYVHPVHRNKGISFRLIDRLVAEARRLGYQELYLVTEEAKGLYSRYGCIETELMTTPHGEASLMRNSYEN